MIFKSSVIKREFPSEWKKANVVLVLKKIVKELQIDLIAANFQKNFRKNNLQ